MLVLVLVLDLRADILEAPGLRVHFEARDEGRARQAAAMVREISGQIEARLGLPPPAPLDVHLAESDAAFDRTVGALAAGATPPRWALAVAIPGARAVVIRAGRLEALTWNDLRPTLAHELAHLALGRAGRIPRWLNEGLAMWASGRRLRPEERTHLQRLARAGELDALDGLARSFPPHAEEAHVSYLESLAFVESLDEAVGAAAVPELLRLVEAGTPFEQAFERAFAAPLRGYELAWRADLARRYSFWRDLWERSSLLTVAAILVVLAFARYLVKRRRLLEAMREAEPPPPANEPRNIDV